MTPSLLDKRLSFKPSDIETQRELLRMRDQINTLLGGLNTSAAGATASLAKRGIRAEVNRSTAQTIHTATDTDIIFDSEQDDPWGFHDPLGANPERLTVPAGFGGMYLCGYNFSWGLNTTANRSSRIVDNFGGATCFDEGAPQQGNGARSVGQCKPQRLGDGEWIKLRVSQTTGGDLDVQNFAGPRLWLLRIGD